MPLLLLEAGAPESIATMLDWGIKHAVFRGHTSHKGGSWEACRDELLELDIRFGALDDGILERHDAEDFLDHRVEGIGNIADALHAAARDACAGAGRGHHGTVQRRTHPHRALGPGGGSYHQNVPRSWGILL